MMLTLLCASIASVMFTQAKQNTFKVQEIIGKADSFQILSCSRNEPLR